MGASASSKGDPFDFPPGPAKDMVEKYVPDVVQQFPKWILLGFPEKGSFSEHQINKLKKKMFIIPQGPDLIWGVQPD